MNISANKLMELGACDEARKWFSNNYRGTVTIDRNMIDKCPSDNWPVWLALRLSEELRWKVARIAYREVANVLPVLAQWAETLNASNYRDAEKAAHSAGHMATTDAASCAACHAAVAATHAALPPDYATDIGDHTIYAAALAARFRVKAELHALAVEFLLNTPSAANQAQLPDERQLELFPGCEDTPLFSQKG